MRKAYEYVNDFWGEAPIGDIVSHYDICDVIKRVQADTIRETCQDCADFAQVLRTEDDKIKDILGHARIFRFVDKSSILEVAEKLIKEL